MSRRQREVVVVGAGVVGAACALALARAGLAVSLVEAAAPRAFSVAKRDLRVYAIAPDNAALLADLGVWQDILSTRAQPYRQMRVRDAAGGGELHFSADDLGRRELGWIVENDLLAERLWQAAAAAGVEMLAGEEVVALASAEDGMRVQFAQGASWHTRLLVAADGANSRLRQLAGIAVTEKDYRQQGVVAYVETQTTHQQTAWQRFLPEGPLAFLPCDATRLCSIVWSLPDAEAERVMALDEAGFNQALTSASAGWLGDCRLVFAQAAFPLRRRLARQQCQGRLLLIGDAAHAVHPLAGQGVNLGLRDVAGLLAEVRKAGRHGSDFAASHRLQRWARQRRSDNVLSAHAFETINRVYSNDALLPTLLRGHALGLASAITPLRDALWRHAAGIRG